MADLSVADMRDLAAYYAYLPRVSDYPPVASTPPRIVASGEPMRGIAPCGVCHGGFGNKAGAAWLAGEPLVYLRGQLEAFASGARPNDISEQMRNVARSMTPAEIDAASRFYADPHSDRVRARCATVWRKFGARTVAGLNIYLRLG